MRRRILVSVVALSVGLLAVEGYVRVRQWMRFGITGHYLIDSVFDPATQHLVPAPGQKTNRLTTDSRGFRSPELVMPKPPGTIRLAFLGASTTLCLEATKDESTWPHRVTEMAVGRFPQRKFDYINASMTGWGVADTEKDYKSRVLPCGPDVVFIYHATNDLVRTTRNLASVQGWSSDGTTDEPSGLGRISLAWYLIEKNIALRRRGKPATDRAPLAIDPATLTISFDAALRSLITTIQQGGAVPVVITFSHRARRTQSEAEQREACQSSLFYMPWMTPASILDGFELFNKSIRKIATEMNCILVDVEDEIPGEKKYFNDSVHLTDAGCEALSERIMKHVFEDPRFTARLNMSK